MKEKCCTLLLHCTVLQADIRRADGETLQEHWRIEVSKDMS
jgi:hypothetical protein